MTGTRTDQSQLRRNARKLDRLNSKISAVLTAMERGEALLLEHRWFGRAWCLSGGQRVDDEVAKIVVQDHNVVGVGDSLFGNTPSQTWRWTED
jgi:hypothetical protein